MYDIDQILAKLEELWVQAVEIWLAGGWSMVAIAVTALAMFAMGMHIQLRLRSKGFARVPEKAWRRWIEHPDERRGPIGEVLDFVTGGRSISDVELYFEELRTIEIVPFERDLRVMKVCVSAAPLLGLLGTVTGMLTTFSALAAGSGGDKTMSMVAGGISEALITTETGLVIALPGMFFWYMLSRKHERYRTFLAQLETACMLSLYRRVRQQRASKAGNIHAGPLPVGA